MNVLELFSGTRSVGKCCDNIGFNSVSVDMILPADHQVDIMDFDYKQYPPDTFDVIWASPPCVEYSKLQDAWLNRMRKGKIYTKEVQEEEMKQSDKLVLKTLEIIDYFKPHLWFIENPQSGRLKHREFMKSLNYYDVDYCKYSDWGYRKRTRIWTNKKDFQPLICKKDCSSIVDGKHKNNLGNFERTKITNGLTYSQQERYRIPPELIYSLLLN